MLLTLLTSASLLGASAWHWPTPEQILYPTAEARLAACLTAKPAPTAAELKQAREVTSQHLAFFVPPVNSLQGACVPVSDRYPALTQAANEFKSMLQSGQAPAPTAVVTLMAPIKTSNEARHWMAFLVLQDARGQIIKRWKPRTGMVRSLTPGSGLSILIFDVPSEHERPQVRQATKLLLEVGWGNSQNTQVFETHQLPTY